MEHSFNTNIATQYDVNIALLLQHFKFWTFNNLANKRHIHDGLCWTYNKLDSFPIIFPYWSKKQIRNILDKCVSENLIVKGNYNKTTYDRTCWYALTEKAYLFFPELCQLSFIELLFDSIKDDSAICPNGQMDFPKWAHRFAQKGTPIPDTDPDTDPDIKKKINKKESSSELSQNVYTEFDGETEKSDYQENQAENENNHIQPIESKIDNTKSDYCHNQRNKESNGNSNKHFALKDILSDNIFQIPEEIIQDWLITRKKKPITRTTWNTIQKDLAKCKEKGIDPIEAFEAMVSSCWLSVKPEYFETNKKNPAIPQWTVDSVMRA